MNSCSKLHLHNVATILSFVLGCVALRCNMPSSSSSSGWPMPIDDPEDFPDCHRLSEGCNACSDQFGCVDCDKDADCIGGGVDQALCVFGYCSRCRTSADCNAGMVCSPRTRSCDTPCVSNANCDGAHPVCSPSHACVDCASNADCSGERPLCDQELGQCTQCMSAKDCAAPTTICDRRRGLCADCMVDEDCSVTGYEAYCDANAICRSACVKDADCADPDLPNCTIYGICVAQ